MGNPESQVPNEKDVDVSSQAKGEVYESYGLVKSRFDDLSLPRTVWLFKWVVLVVMSVYTGYLCEGIEFGAGSSIIANAGFIKQFGDGKGDGVRALSATWVSTWSALVNVGQIITFTHISWFADRFGRKKSLYLAWLWLAVAWAFFNGAKTPAVWALGKLCTGCGIGVLQVVCQIYVMEVSPNRIRGGLIVLQTVWSQIGGIIVSVMVQQLNKKHPEDYLLVMRIVWGPIALMLVAWAIVPETPWFHCRRGEKEKALKVMRRLYSGVPGYDFEEEYGIIERTIEHEKQVLQEAPSFFHIFKGIHLKRTMTVAVLAISQQLVGLSIIFTYSTYFFSLAGLKDPFLGTVILNCVNLLAVILWTLTADKIGRRMNICMAETLCVLILFTVGGLDWSGATTGNATAGTVLLVICCFWTFFFQIIGMSYFVYSAELPAAILRMKTAPATFFTNSIFGIATNYATPPMLLNISLRTAFVYGAFSVPIAIFMWLYLPETKGRSAAEIDELYERKIPAWRWSKTKTVAEEQMHAVISVRGGI